MEIEARNHSQVARLLYPILEQEGVSMPSRNGPVLRMPGVTTLWVAHPWERVNFSPERNANPFFHLIEAMAMLAGLNSVELMSYFAKNMASFSDDGERYNAFYGERLRSTWGDQLARVINELEKQPHTRQAVAQIWDPSDLYKETKDKACNLCLIFEQDYNTKKLNMTSFNRSNDAIWGMGTGANVVHLSFFQEFVACALGWEMGSWTHVSNNLHVYTENPQWEKVLKDSRSDWCLYPNLDRIALEPLFVGDHRQFTTALQNCLADMLLAIRGKTVLSEHSGYHQRFLISTVVPVFNAWQYRKLGYQRDHIKYALVKISAPDWHTACARWVERNGYNIAKKGTA